MASGMRERVDGFGIENGEGVLDVFSSDSFQERLGRSVHALPPGSAGAGGLKRMIMLCNSSPRRISSWSLRFVQLPASLDLRLAPVGVDFTGLGIGGDRVVGLVHGERMGLWCGPGRLHHRVAARLVAGGAGGRSGRHFFGSLGRLHFRCPGRSDLGLRQFVRHCGVLDGRDWQ